MSKGGSSPVRGSLLSVPVGVWPGWEGSSLCPDDGWPVHCVLMTVGLFIVS